MSRFLRGMEFRSADEYKILVYFSFWRMRKMSARVVRCGEKVCLFLAMKMFIVKR